MADALLDTTFFIDFHRGDAGARGIWTRIREGAFTVSASAITVFELWVGKIDRREELAYRAMLTMTEAIVPVSDVHAEAAALWLRDLPPGVSEAVVRDAFIAAAAEERREPIFTRNVRDFTRFYRHVERY